MSPSIYLPLDEKPLHEHFPGDASRIALGLPAAYCNLSGPRLWSTYLLVVVISLSGKVLLVYFNALLMCDI